MADAVCGPVNPLSNFQKHTQRDRTLQTDRLVSRAGPSQGFRSPASNAGVLDPEFEAFQAGFPAATVAAPISTPSPFLQQRGPNRFHTPPAQIAPSSVPDWALDFQRLNLSTPSPVHSLASKNVHSSSAHTNALALQPMMPEPAFADPMMEHVHTMSMVGAGYGPGVGLGYMSGPQMNMNQHQVQGPMPVLDDAAFAAAFDSAAASLGPIQQPAQKVHNMRNVHNEEYDALMRSEEELDQIMSEYPAHQTSMTEQASFEINQARFQDPTMRHEQPLMDSAKPMEESMGRQDTDALARTAGELLDSVSHDTSDKFAQSSFMALMRSLRDHEVKVDGENFVDSSTNDIMNTTGMPSSTEEIEPDANETAGGNIARPAETWEPIGES